MIEMDDVQAPGTSGTTLSFRHAEAGATGRQTCAFVLGDPDIRPWEELASLDASVPPSAATGPTRWSQQAAR